MKSLYSAVGWIIVYLLLVLAPLLVLITGEVPAGAGFKWDFSMALGFSGMAIVSVLFLLTARFRRATAPFGMDIIYYFHRYLALLAFLFIVTHYLIIRVAYSEVLITANPLQAPAYMTAGRAAIFLFAIIIVTSLWRKSLHIHYEEWRMLHIGLSVSAFILALVHIIGTGNYIDAPVKRWIWTSYTFLWLLLVVYVRLVKPWRMKRKPYRVTEVREQCCNSWTLAVEPVGHSGIRFKPGQFAWLTLHASPWEIKEHPFSISSSASNLKQLEFTIKELGDFTRTVKDTRVGDIAYLDGPYGVFTVDAHPNAPGYVFIAGGVGAAPIISMLKTLADRNDKRPLYFLYGNKHWNDILYAGELETLKSRLDLNIVYVLNEPPANWTGETGLIDQRLLENALPRESRSYDFFLCGPQAMSDAVQKGLHNMGVPLGKIHFELFNMV